VDGDVRKNGPHHSGAAATGTPVFSGQDPQKFGHRNRCTRAAMATRLFRPGLNTESHSLRVVFLEKNILFHESTLFSEL